MSNSINGKPIPRSVLIFGAAGHIGGPLARFLGCEAPQIRLRLVSSRPDRGELLRREFPAAEVVSANYFDHSSLELAVQGMEGIFVVTPGGLDEQPAMTNLVAAVSKAGTSVQVLRILDESDLPVTYLNCGATFMDNFFLMTAGLRRERKLIWHDRLIPFIDPRDIAEVAGRLLLSDNHRHIGQFHTLNNGHDLMRYSEVAELMSEVFGEKIGFDGSREGFFNAYAHLGDLRTHLWAFFEYERDNEVVWARNDFVERMLGRKPTTLRQWLQEHARHLLT